jgi:hypothetical protein
VSKDVLRSEGGASVKISTGRKRGPAEMCISQNRQPRVLDRTALLPGKISISQPEPNLVDLDDHQDRNGPAIPFFYAGNCYPHRTTHGHSR